MVRIAQQALTFDDVLLLPGHSTVLPKSVSLGTQLTANINLQIPLLSAAMDTVTEALMAIGMAQEGGLGVVHKNMSIEAQVGEIHKVKKFESGVVKDPIAVTPKTTVGEVLALCQQHGFFGFPVIEDTKLVGIVTSRDVRFVSDSEKPVSSVMTPKDRLVTVLEGTERKAILELFHEHRIEKILVVNKDFQLRGMVTVRDILKADQYPNSCKDDQERLRVGAAVGTSKDTEERIRALIDAGVDVLFVDTAHGHSQKVIDQVAWIKNYNSTVQVVGGNIATGDAAKALVDAGADAVKVGIGPGSICTTRVVTGVGLPQITAIDNVAEALKNTSVKLIADGGIRFSGDISKALAAGADCIMIGSLFAGTDEAPGEIELHQGRSYKTYRGMGSLAAMAQYNGSSDRYFQDPLAGANKLVPEGIEGRVAYKGGMRNVLTQLIGGLRSAMGYTGCDSISKLKTEAEFVSITHAGRREGHVHDVQIAKAPPNYQVESHD